MFIFFLNEHSLLTETFLSSIILSVVNPCKKLCVPSLLDFLDLTHYYNSNYISRQLNTGKQQIQQTMYNVDLKWDYSNPIALCTVLTNKSEIQILSVMRNLTAAIVVLDYCIIGYLRNIGFLPSMDPNVPIQVVRLGKFLLHSFH